MKQAICILFILFTSINSYSQIDTNASKAQLQFAGVKINHYNRVSNIGHAFELVGIVFTVCGAITAAHEVTYVKEHPESNDHSGRDMMIIGGGIGLAGYVASLIATNKIHKYGLIFKGNGVIIPFR